MEAYHRHLEPLVREHGMISVSPPAGHQHHRTVQDRLERLRESPLQQHRRRGLCRQDHRLPRH
jgi:hypothetical protein